MNLTHLYKQLDKSANHYLSLTFVRCHQSGRMQTQNITEALAVEKTRFRRTEERWRVLQKKKWSCPPTLWAFEHRRSPFIMEAKNVWDSGFIVIWMTPELWKEIWKIIPASDVKLLGYSCKAEWKYYHFIILEYYVTRTLCFFHWLTVVGYELEDKVVTWFTCFPLTEHWRF